MGIIKYREKVKCDFCPKISEGYELRRNFFVKVQICESCISRIFRGLHKER